MALTNKYNTVNADNRTGINLAHGVYESIVMENKDALLMGRLAVYIPELGGNVDDPQSWKTVRYASPFYGITPYREQQLAPVQGQDSFTSQNPADLALTGRTPTPPKQQGPITSYGMWAVPPDLGVTVLVMFAGGDLNRGFWFACVPTVSHGMVPAIGAPDGKTPMSEFNPIDPQVPVTEDLKSIQREPHQPLVDSLTAQGINEDPLRGPITSSSFREAPSNVFGISSRSGHTFVMDDGDEGGKSKLIRLRTAGGNQITMHDDTGMIYMINAQGTGWLEISPSGQIDVYGAKGINMATNGDINFHADNNINMHANNCIKIVASNGTKVMGGSELQLHGGKTMIEGVDSLHVHSCKEMMITSFADIHMKAFNYFCLKGKCFYWNSCTAKEAEQVPPEKPADVSGYQTTVARAPSKEPYKEHDNGQSQGGGSAAGDAGGAGGMDTAETSLGNDFSLPAATSMSGGMDTRSTSLGNNFTLPFNQGANYPNAPSVELRTNVGSVPGGQGIVPQNSLTTGGTAAVIGGGGVMATRPATLSASQTSNIINARRTATITQPSQSTLANISTGAGTGSLGKASSGSTIFQSNYTSPNAMVGSGGSLSVTTTQGTYTTSQTTAVQGQDVFTSQNPADRLATEPRNLTGNPANTGSGSNPTAQPADVPSTPAQEASNALDQTFGQSPSSDLPSAPGGGGTGCFATGDNCQRPADQTGGGGGSTSGGVPDNLDTTLGQTPEELQKTYDQLRDQGLTHEQAIGAMANIQRESGFRPGAVGDNGNSIGLYQLNAPAGRAQGLINSTPDWQTNAAAQHAYMFNNDAGGRMFKSQNFSSSIDAANYFTNRVEIPAARASYTASGGYNSRVVPKLEASIKRRP